jgi:hypothetical protein
MASQFKTFTAGSVLTASEMNTYLMKQAVIVCDSTADYPSSPVEGMTVYDKGADALRVYTTATTTWKAPWNLPWGYVTSANITSNSANLTTLTDITGLSVTPTVVANRQLKITFTGFLDSTVSTDSIASYITDGSNTQLMQGYVAGIGGGTTHTVIAYVTTTAGSPTYKVRAARVSGTGNVKIGASATTPATIMVEDIGPSGAPA